MLRTLFLMLMFTFLSSVTQAKIVGFKEWKFERIRIARLSMEKAKQSVAKEARSQSERDASPGEKTVLSNLVKLQQKSQSAGGGLNPPSPAELKSKKGGPSFQRLRQAELSLEIAQELNVNDYFILYLSQFQSREAFEEAAGKLSKAEVGQLLMAYKKQLLGGGTVDDAPVPADIRPSRAVQSERNASR